MNVSLRFTDFLTKEEVSNYFSCTYSRGPESGSKMPKCCGSGDPDQTVLIFEAKF